MKLSNTPGEIEKNTAKQIKKFYPKYEDLVSCTLTWMGSLYILLEFMSENYPNPLVLPEKTQYGICLGMYHFDVLRKIVKKEIYPDEFKMIFMHTEEEAWDSKKKLTPRMHIIIRELYKMIEKDKGK